MVSKIYETKRTVHQGTDNSVSVPPDYKEKVTNFRKFTQSRIAEDSIGPDDIITMDEVPLTFDLPLTRTVNKKGESSITLKTTGHERIHFT